MNRVQSFLRQEQIQAALSKATSLVVRCGQKIPFPWLPSRTGARVPTVGVAPLARRWKFQETLDKVPQQLRHWQVQERLDRFYRNYILPRIKIVNNDRDKVAGDLDRIIDRGRELESVSADKLEEWKLAVIDWLNDGEVLLRGRMPGEFSKLKIFAVRVSPYSRREQFDQMLSDRLQMLASVRRRRRTRIG
jgi:hypothetical protein